MSQETVKKLQADAKSAFFTEETTNEKAVKKLKKSKNDKTLNL